MVVYAFVCGQRYPGRTRLTLLLNEIWVGVFFLTLDFEFEDSRVLVKHLLGSMVGVICGDSDLLSC